MQVTKTTILTGGLAMLFWLFAATAISAAALSVDVPIYQFESVVDGASVSHTFKLKNTGNSPVKVLKVEPP